MDLLITAIAILFLAVLGTFYFHPKLDFNPTPPNPSAIMQKFTAASPTPNTHPHFTGQISSVVRNLNLLIVTPDNQPELNITITPQTKLVDQDNQPISLDNLQKGFSIEGDGTLTSTNAITATNIKLTKSPNIVVFIPTPNSQVSSQFEVSGVGRVFENQVSVEIKNHTTGTVYSQGSTLTDAQNMGGYGNFYYQANLKNTADLKNGTSLDINVFQRSAKDGSIIDQVTVPVVYTP